MPPKEESFRRHDPCTQHQHRNPAAVGLYLQLQSLYHSRMLHIEEAIRRDRLWTRYLLHYQAEA